jgi:hypothetical protein
MSDHARLFASAVPENGSSDTIGENGDNQRGEADITQQTGNVGQYTPEPSNDGQHGTSPTREIGNDERGSPDDRESNQIEEECIEQMDDIVESFRSNEITKLKALSTIISILDLNPSRTEGAKDAAVECYAKTLDEIQALSSSAVRRSRIAERALGSERRTPDRTESPRPTDHDAKINELISQISQDSKRSNHGDSDNELDFNGTSSNKKRRVFESEMPWYTREEEARRSGNKDCEESRKILHLFARDYKVVKQWIQNSRTTPLGFPGSEWDNIIRGQAVNLDAVFSSLHHISAPKENIGS